MLAAVPLQTVWFEPTDADGRLFMVMEVVVESLQLAPLVSTSFTVPEPAVPQLTIILFVPAPEDIVPPLTFQLYTLPVVPAL